jgi:hypothetical protein
VRGGAEGGERGTRGGQNTRWQREAVESLWLHRKSADIERDAEGVRAELLAQKAIYDMESQTWRHPLVRLAAIWEGWRRRLWRS